MIYYDSGTWGFGFIWKLEGSVFPKSLVWACPCAAFAIGLSWYLQEVENGSNFRVAVGVDDSTRSIVAGYTSILGFLIVFRSQQAYSRWWEGGTLLNQLRGEWFNAYSNVLAFCSADPKMAKEKKALENQMLRLWSLLYCMGLQQVTTMRDKSFDVIDQEGFDEEKMKFLFSSYNRVDIVMQWIQRMLVNSTRNGTLDIAPPILSRVFQELSRGVVNLNNVTKITEYPFPFPYSQMITVLLIFQSIITPLVCAVSIKSPGWAGLSTFILIFAYSGVNYIASEIEMPCGDDSNDLPLREMQREFNMSLCALLSDEAQTVPDFRTLDSTFGELHTFSMDTRITKSLVEPADGEVKRKGSKGVPKVSPFSQDELPAQSNVKMSRPAETMEVPFEMMRVNSKPPSAPAVCEIAVAQADLDASEPALFEVREDCWDDGRFVRHSSIDSSTSDHYPVHVVHSLESNGRALANPSVIQAVGGDSRRRTRIEGNFTKS